MTDFNNAIQAYVFPLSPSDLHLKMQGDWDELMVTMIKFTVMAVI